MTVASRILSYFKSRAGADEAEFHIALVLLFRLALLAQQGAVRLGWRNVLKVGLGMVPRGEVGMVIAQLGLGMAVISAEVYSVVVFMVVPTTIVTPLLLKVALREPPPPSPGTA